MTPQRCLPSEERVLQPRYRHYADTRVKQTTLEFHTRTLFTAPDCVPSTYYSRVAATAIREAEFTETWLQPVYTEGIPLPAKSTTNVPRERSANGFAQAEHEPAAALLQLLADSLAAFPPDTDFAPPIQHRPYASAGALFPVETLVALLRSPSDAPEWQPGLYHLLPNSQCLARVQPDSQHPFNPEDWFPPNFGEPLCALCFFVNLDKAIFKYLYRGYRHALMEVGAMTQQVDCAARHFDLRTRAWSGFSDDRISTASGFNPRKLLPLLINCIGWEAQS